MASTYVNNLRLNEMGTGDASGTWGTTTNTNLELIGEALGFGTEAITTNADTHTTTVADGASDAGRAMYLKYTGTLDSACTITIAPNTMKRMQLIENGTSGSQNIIISQGSGANITIPPGDTKAVYLDGAGSGAAVVDAFASLSTVDLKVQDDLTVTDDATIGGTLGVTGVVTANAGVVVDNITIDGTEIDLSSGDLTIDVAGMISLNADNAGTVIFEDASVQYLVVENSSSDAVIRGGVQDKDILFKGNDNGAAITALTLDMSEAGAAIFNSTVTANAGVVVDNITIDGTEIDLSSGNLTLDVAGVIKLDADGGEVAFLDGGTEVGVISMGSSNMNIESKVADKDIIFKGIDGSSDVTALTLDMSGGGLAVFGGGINSSGSTNSTTHSLLTLESSVDANPSRMNMFFKSGQGTIAAISGRQNAGGSDAYGALDFNTANAGTLATKMTILNNGQLELKGGTTSGVQEIVFNNSFASIADGSTLTLTSVLNTGALISIGHQRSNLGVTYDHCLLFAEQSTAFTILADPSDRFAINSATTDGKTNIFVNGSSVVIQNEVGTTNLYSVAVFRFQGT
tara:strand:+ start:597 stop:2315 length:1719 start_codon:yes stop_codon:yes gene_type:complete